MPESALAMFAGAELVIDTQHFECLSFMGKGSYGEVWVCRTLPPEGSDANSRTVAIKEVACTSHKAVDQVDLEISVLKKLERTFKRNKKVKKGPAWSVALETAP